MDTKLKTWNYTQWLSAVGIIQLMIFQFTITYITIYRLSLNISLSVFVNIFISMYIFLYTLGVFVDMQKRKFLIQLGIPYAITIADIILVFLLKRPFNGKIIIYYYSFIKYIVSYSIFASSMYLCYLKTEFTYSDIPLIDKLKLGFITEEQYRILSGGDNN